MAWPWCALVASFVVLVATTDAAKIKDFKNMSKNISWTLDNLLAAGRYDKRVRPDLGGPPTEVTVSVYIKSMGSVSENDQSYSMDTYFRQSWVDARLQFSLPGLSEFSMSWLFLERVWKPDTFFVNGHHSHLHRITVPNKFLRVRSDGYITYSMRLTVQARCKMHLRKFPLDSQQCPLLIGSYGYTAKDVLYKWHDTGVGLEPGVELAQYELSNITTVPARLFSRGPDKYSVITATFHLTRNTGYYTLQVFVPMMMIVFCSWMSFWIDPDATPARVSLAVTTVLSMTTMGFGGRSSMPRVNHATAMDSFVILCFAFVFAVMVEYALINFIDKVTVDYKRILEERKKKKEASVVKAEELQPLIPESAPEEEPVVVEDEAHDGVQDVIQDARESRSASKEASGAGGSRRASSRTSSSFAASLLRHVSRSLGGLASGSVASSSTDDTATDDIPLVAVGDPPPAVATADSIGDLPGPSPSPAHSLPEDEDHQQRQNSGHMLDAIEHDDDGGDDDDDDDVQSRGPAPKSSDCVVAIEVESVKIAQAPIQEEEEEISLEGSVAPPVPRLRRCLAAVVALLDAMRILPNEEEVRIRMESKVEPEKFTRIDRMSRRAFPIAFAISIIFYWFMYVHYITDRYPEDEGKDEYFDA